MILSLLKEKWFIMYFTLIILKQIWSNGHCKYVLTYDDHTKPTYD